MKRLNPETNEPFRCGYYNPDTGMYFRGYDKNKLRKTGYFVELWLNPESFHAIRERMKLRARDRRSKTAFQKIKSTKELISDLDSGRCPIEN